jgi:ATP-dependent helicase HrpA
LQTGVVAVAANGPSKTGLPEGVFKVWDFGDLPRTVDQAASAVSSTATETASTLSGAQAGYCAFVDQGDGAQISAFSQEGASETAHHAGLTRLFLLRAVQAVRGLKKDKAAKSLGVFFGLTPEVLLQQTLAKAVDMCFIAQLSDPYSQTAFDDCWAQQRNQFVSTHQQLMETLTDLAEQVAAVRRSLLAMTSPALAQPQKALEDQLSALLEENFILQTPAAWLARYPIYCEGMLSRINRLQGNLQRDAQNEATVQALWQQFQTAMSQRAFPSDALRSVRWMLEEFRLSLFAQGLKTQGKVSAKRIQKHLDTHR